LYLCGATLKRRKKMDDNPETQVTELEEISAPAKKSRRWLWVILGVVLVLVLAAAAFLGGRYLQKGSSALGGGGGIFLSSTGPGGQVSRSISKNDIIPAPELPKTAADERGILVRRQNNSIFIGTGRVTLQVKKQADNPNSTPQTGTSYDGPVVEVVVTNKTKVYRDVTFQNLKDLPSDGTKIQQKVVPGSLDEIGQTSFINAWGKKTGDRLIADVLLYNNPVIMAAPGGGK
jgi:flagellar basal body-associated protein FliL